MHGVASCDAARKHCWTRLSFQLPSSVPNIIGIILVFGRNVEDACELARSIYLGFFFSLSILQLFWCLGHVESDLDACWDLDTFHVPTCDLLVDVSVKIRVQ